MMSRAWWPGALAVSACLALAGRASADDDIFNLKLKGSQSLAAESAAGTLSPDARAQADEGDLEEVNLRYRLGFSRAYFGGGYIVPRFYAFRAGYHDGLYSGYGGYGGGYYGRGYYGSGYYGGGYYGGGYYGGGYYGRAYYTAAPIYYDPCYCTSIASSIPASTIGIPRSSYSAPIDSQPLPRGNRSNSLPMPTPQEIGPQPGEPAPKRSSDSGSAPGSSTQRLVKLKYPAFGEHQTAARTRDTEYVKNRK